MFRVAVRFLSVLLLCSQTSSGSMYLHLSGIFLICPLLFLWAFGGGLLKRDGRWVDSPWSTVCRDSKLSCLPLTSSKHLLKCQLFSSYPLSLPPTAVPRIKATVHSFCPMRGLSLLWFLFIKNLTDECWKALIGYMACSYCYNGIAFSCDFLYPKRRGNNY